MRLVHSLWSKPMVKNRWFLEGQLRASIWLYALSFLYARKLAIGEVVLYTDDLGAEYLDCIPYDEIHTTLNELEKTHQKFWALGKIKALEKEPLGSLHFDGDVFFKSDKIKPLLHFGEADVIAQMIEAGELFEKGYRPQMPYFDNALKGVYVEGYGFTNKAYNGGVLGFNNINLKEQFIWNVELMVSECSKDTGIMFNMDGKYEPNIIIEQHQLAGLVEAKKYKSKFILDPVEVDRFNSLQIVANKYGFVHAWGKSKYTVNFQAKVQELVKAIDEDVFQSITKKIKRL